MADDGMILNFEVGSGPYQAPRPKLTGGRWRDRKRAERSLRGRDNERPAKRPRREENDASEIPPRYIPDPGADAQAKPKPKRTSPPPRPKPLSARPPQKPAQNGEGGQKRQRQVVSKLFTFNPEQKTTFEDEEEWTAPEPTNAPLTSVANFGSLTISSRLVEQLAKMNVDRPTGIQNKVVPHMLSSSDDAFVQAETGSGKTLAYLLPMLHRILQLSAQGNKIHRESGIFAIVVAPTRELAKQTHTVLEQLLRPFPWLVSTAITGGESKKAEKARIRKGVNFLVATPGRLADHLDNTKALNLRTVRWLILDEGDRLMDLGFEDDLKKAITALKRVAVDKTTDDGTPLESLPDRRVTVLCSATMKINVQKLGEMSLADAAFLAAEKGDGDATIQDQSSSELKAPAQLHQSHVIVPSKLRLVTLLAYLKSVYSRRGKTMKAIIFMSCADSVDFHYELLRHPKNPASTKDENVAKTVGKAAYITTAASPEVLLHRMHGSLSQATRTATLKSFAAAKMPSLLITTDVSSRGLDIPSVDLVIEYDPAFSFADHIHRVGRTARAGRPGDALLFLLPGTEEGYIKLLQASTPPSAQSYESILRTGLMTKLEFPVETNAAPEDGHSYHDKAETMQLHLEQRILNDAALLQLARDGFKSQIRAYATHTRDERVYFDITELHLGHTAKSFGLREAPGGIGSGLDRRAKKKKGPKEGPKEGPREGARDGENAEAVLRKKSMLLMSAAADEFNIG